MTEQQELKAFTGNGMFVNRYDLPAATKPYTRVDTTVKTDWTARWIWDASDGSKKNVWMAFRKTVTVTTVPTELIAHIAADSRYWLYLNGQQVVFEGSVKRGPTPRDSYYDKVDLAPYLHAGENCVAVLVWYWGNSPSYSNVDSGHGGFLLEAKSTDFSLISDNSWRVQRHTAYKQDPGPQQPNYRLPESNIYYDATCEIGAWETATFDDSAWDNATEIAVGGEGIWGQLYARPIPLWKDYGLRDYENSAAYQNTTAPCARELTMILPYNAQCTPYLKVTATAGQTITITTENTKLGAVKTTYLTKDGEQAFEGLGWFNGERITYAIPAGVTVKELKYRETGYNTAFSGAFCCDDPFLTTLWHKSLRTLYVTMRDNFMDCPDRERAQWWGDVTNEMTLSMYSLDTDAYLLYQKGVQAMLGHIDPATRVLQTVIPIQGDYFELPMQQLAGVVGFWTYYQYTGDVAFVRDVYQASLNYLALWQSQENGLVTHRSGSWDWLDWGEKFDVVPLENAWYYYALTAVREMALLLGDAAQAQQIAKRQSVLYRAYQTLWCGNGYSGDGGISYDDRGNAVAVLAGLCPKERYAVITDTLFAVRNASPYMEHYVLQALCSMEEIPLAEQRMRERYLAMIQESYSTLWEFWDKQRGTMNHAWSGGPLLFMSKYVAGIRPLTAGYEQIEVRPSYHRQAVSCTVPTVKGYVTLAYTAKSDCIVIDLTYPAGTEVQLHLPPNAEVTANGRRLAASEIVTKPYVWLK